MNEVMVVNNGVEIPKFTNKNLQNATNKVFKLGETVRRCAYETAYIMATVDETECYKDDGFNSVHDWAMTTFGFKKSASYTMLRVGKEYTQVLKDSKGRIKGYTSNLIDDSPDAVDFTTTQIEKMLPIGHDSAVALVNENVITPDMSCREIGKIIKSYTNPEDESEVNEDESEVDEDDEESETETESEDIRFIHQIVYEELENGITRCELYLDTVNVEKLKKLLAEYIY